MMAVDILLFLKYRTSAAPSYMQGIRSKPIKKNICLTNQLSGETAPLSEIVFIPTLFLKWMRHVRKRTIESENFELIDNRGASQSSGV